MSAVAAADHKLAARPVEVHPLHWERKRRMTASGRVQHKRSLSNSRAEGAKAGKRPGPDTCGVVAVSLVSPEIVGPVAVVGVKQVDVLVIVTGQQLCAQIHRLFRSQTSAAC